MITSSTSRQQLLAQKSFLQARVTNYYTSNISAGDHIKFNSVVNGNGTDITLDTSTTYTSTAGVASIGRFTLKAGKTYKLYATVQGNGTTGVSATFVWYNSTANAAVSGSRAYPLSPAFSGGNGPVPEATAFITTQVDTLVELRINSVTDLNTIEGADSNDATFAVIESVDQTINVQTQKVTSYIRRTGGTTRGSTNSNVVIFSTPVEQNGTDITYVNDATNGDSFVINTNGLYAVTFGFTVNSSNPTVEICVGSAISNSNFTTNVRTSRRSWITGGQDPDQISWTGYITAGQKIWIYDSGSSGSTYPYINQIEIVGPL